MDAIWTWLQGKKTYIIAVITVAYAVMQAATGHMAWDDAIKVILAALGLGVGINSAIQRIDKKLGNGVKMFLIGTLLLGLVGCQNQAAQLQPQIVAGAAGVTVADGFFITGGLSAVHAKAVYQYGIVADGAFKVALQSIAAGNTPDVTTANEIMAALSGIATELADTPAGPPASARLARMKAAGATKDLSPTDIAVLIQLAIQFLPEVMHDINLLVTGSTVTVQDCQMSLATYEAALAKLQADIAAKGG